MKKTLVTIVALVALVMLSVCVLSACAPNSDPSKAQAALKNNGYSGGKLSTLVVPGSENIVYGVYTPEEGDTEGVIIVYYESKDKAKAAYDTVKTKATALRALIGVSEDEDARWSFKQSGCMVWYGTDAGVKAAR